MNQYTRILLIFFGILFFYSCEQSPSVDLSTITMGDKSTVQNYRSLEGSQLDLFSEDVFDGRSFKNYNKEIDLDEDGYADIKLFYSTQVGIDGYLSYNAFVSPKNNTLRIAGFVSNILDENRWAPVLFEEGESIGRNSPFWNSDSSQSVRLFMVLNNPGIEEYNYNYFPTAVREAYVVFTMLNSENKQVIGWLKLSLDEELLKPELIDVGYNILE